MSVIEIVFVIVIVIALFILPFLIPVRELLYVPPTSKDEVSSSSPSSPSSRSFEVSTPTTIPRTIITLKNINSYNRDLNPEYDVDVFDDNTARNFVVENMPDVNYDAVPLDLRRSVFVACYLYIRGGVYLDSSLICIQPLREWIRKDDSFVRNDKMTVIASVPQHPYMKEYIETFEIPKAPKILTSMGAKIMRDNSAVLFHRSGEVLYPPILVDSTTPLSKRTSLSSHSTIVTTFEGTRISAKHARIAEHNAMMAPLFEYRIYDERQRYLFLSEFFPELLDLYGSVDVFDKRKVFAWAIVNKLGVIYLDIDVKLTYPVQNELLDRAVYHDNKVSILSKKTDEDVLYHTPVRGDDEFVVDNRILAYL
jgi:mannosyltransferase OCH1-like enzyme